MIEREVINNHIKTKLFTLRQFILDAWVSGTKLLLNLLLSKGVVTVAKHGDRALRVSSLEVSHAAGTGGKVTGSSSSGASTMSEVRPKPVSYLLKTKHVQVGGPSMPICVTVVQRLIEIMSMKTEILSAVNFLVSFLLRLIERLIDTYIHTYIHD